MQKTFKKYILSWQFVILILSALISMLFSWAFYSYNDHSFSALRFQNIIHQKSIEAENYRTVFANSLSQNKEWFAVDTTINKKPDGIDVLVYKGDSLCCWTGQVLPFKNESISLLKHKVAKLSNAWYYIESTNYKEWIIFSLVKIKSEYSFKNAFLNEDYAIDLPLVLCKEIAVDEKAEGEKVYDVNGNYLFTAMHCNNSNPAYAKWGMMFLFLALLFFFQFVILVLKNQKTIIQNNLWYLLSVIVSICIYVAHIKFHIPEFLDTTEMFSPVYFGASVFFPNLGSLLIFAIIIFCESFIFYKYVLTANLFLKLSKDTKKRYFTVFFSLVGAFVFWHFLNYIVALLVSNSSSDPIFFKVSELQFFDFIRLFIITILWLSAVFVVEKILVIFLDQIGKKSLSIISGVIVVCGCLYYYSNSTIFASSIMFLVIANMLIWVTRRRNYHAYTTFIWFVGVFAIYAVYSFYLYNYENEKEERKLLVENLSFRLIHEEDPLSEMLLKELEWALESDSIVIKEVSKSSIDVEKLTRYLKLNYFIGYLDRFDVQVIPCWPGGDLFINSDSTTHNCYNFFKQKLNTSGTRVLGSEHFYFLKNKSDIINYFGVFVYHKGIKSKETTLYIDLVVKPYFEGPGYPELLLSERESKLKEPLAHYSYAKYLNGQLSKQIGDFGYPYKINTILKGKKDMLIFYYEGYSHICYHAEDNECIILSLPKVSFSKLIVAFSMFFICFFVFGALLILLTRIKKGRIMYTFSVQERIQIAFVGLMLALLIIIASGSVWQTINRFEIKNNQILAEKNRSVLMELEHKIGKEDKLTSDMAEYLEYLLKKFSSVFYTDLNLYGIDGRLIATSRPELFAKGLSGHLMNSEGFIALNEKEEVEFIHRESIGELKFLSAYVPFVNTKGEVLAYLNTPYFIGSSELREEVSSLVIAIVNFYMIFLIVVIGLTVVVSRRITLPLKNLQSKMGNLSLGGRNEKIEYKGYDEIGQLVKEYNRMVDELEESASKLAKSEREMAWREMARQIAHEIKNPLTPMKLSIQYLERAKADNIKDFDEKLKKVSTTLIDQIDKLSSIASEFSNFAKMPIAKRTRIDVIEVLKQSVTLFEKSKEADLSFNLNGIKRYFIYADSEQMDSVFNNVIKNALQSIPKKREGYIEINTSINIDGIQIEVSDNGIGISEEVQEKLFTPNFTTKTSGMGLGLAIVKNIIANSKGKIWFETELNEGTKFYIQLPKYNKKSL